VRTKITELLDIQYPIIQGGLQGLGVGQLAAAVSEAGGLGLVTAGCFADPDDFAAEIGWVRKQTRKPFGVNISIGSRLSVDAYVDCACKLGVTVVFTSGNNPEKYVEQLKRAGVRWVHVAPSLRFAKKAEQLGADAVVLVGFEAGGHPGLDDIALSILVRRASSELSVPVIAAGGISDGKSFVAALAWGAAGVQIGTRFVLTVESPLHSAIKARLLEAEAGDTVIIERTLRKARRVLKTETASEVLAREHAGAGYEELKDIIGGDAYLKIINEGLIDKGVLSTGQVIGILDDIPTAAEAVRRIVREAREVVASLTRVFD